MIFENLFYIFLFIFPISSSYRFESCCLNEKTKDVNTTRLLSCPLNFVIKLRSVHFYTGNGCSPSACQKRFNKHYLPCNNHRTCSISIQCILMDSSTCPWLTKVNSYSQHLIVDYDCILHPRNMSTKEENIVLFSAKVNIETPPELFNDTSYLDEEIEWKEYFLKKYLKDNPKLFIEEKRSFFSDIIRTVIILFIFAFILITLMLCALWIYKCIRKRKDKHQPFPSDDAYDNLKTTITIETPSDNGSTTDV